jgi:hypothetical protein
VEKVIILSFLQASKGGAWLDTSDPFAVAPLNFQVPCVRSCVFVFGAGGGLESSLLQEEKMKKFAANKTTSKVICFFINDGLVPQNKPFFRDFDSKIPLK